jgi:hypothetical protein
VSGKLRALYRMIEVDAAPTAAQISEVDKADRELTALAATWDALKTSELVPLNAALTAAGIPAVQPEQRLEAPRSGDDE